MFNAVNINFQKQIHNLTAYMAGYSLSSSEKRHFGQYHRVLPSAFVFVTFNVSYFFDAIE
jgi:hypothetical protein